MRRSLAQIAVVALGIGCGVWAEDNAPDVAKLTEQLRASDVNTRRTAAYRLGQLGPQAKDALPELIKALGLTYVAKKPRF